MHPIVIEIQDSFQYTKGETTGVSSYHDLC